jgi:hypothetical protein
MLEQVHFPATGAGPAWICLIHLTVQRTAELDCHCIFANPLASPEEMGVRDRTRRQYSPQELFHAVLTYDPIPTHADRL